MPLLILELDACGTGARFSSPLQTSSSPWGSSRLCCQGRPQPLRFESGHDPALRPCIHPRQTPIASTKSSSTHSVACSGAWVHAAKSGHAAALRRHESHARNSWPCIHPAPTPIACTTEEELLQAFASWISDWDVCARHSPSASRSLHPRNAQRKQPWNPGEPHLVFGRRSRGAL